MLTDVTPPVDGRRPGKDAGLWLSVSALAAERGVSKQGISKQLERWAKAGSPVATRRDGRALLVNVAEYDSRRGDLVDLAKVQGDRTKKKADSSDSADPTYTREQARRMGYQADLAQIELRTKLGELVPVAALEQAAVDCGEVLVRVIDQIATRADEVAAAVAKEGVPGARAVLKAIARDLRSRAAEEFAKLPTLSASPDSAPSEPTDE